MTELLPTLGDLVEVAGSEGHARGIVTGYAHQILSPMLEASGSANLLPITLVLVEFEAPFRGPEGSGGITTHVIPVHPDGIKLIVHPRRSHHVTKGPL